MGVVNNVQTLDHHADTRSVRIHLLEPLTNFLDCRHQRQVIGLFKIPDEIDLFLRYDEDLAWLNGVDIEEGKCVFILINFVTGDVTVNNLGEDRWFAHEASIPCIALLHCALIGYTVVVMSEAASSNWLKSGSVELAKVAGAAAFSALFFAPHAAEHALETTTVETQVADFPAELSFSPGDSRLEVLNQATFYVPKSVGGVGIQAKVTGLPHFSNAKQITNYFSPKRLDVYGSLADSPKEAVAGPVEDLRRGAITSALDFELLWGGVGTVGVYGAFTAVGWLSRLRKLEGGKPIELSGGLIAGLAVMALAGSLTVADQNNEGWINTGAAPKGLVQVGALNGTSLEGTSVDNPFVLNNVNGSIRYATLLKQRRTAQREKYLATAEPELIAGIQALPSLRPDEEIIPVVTDVHSSKAGITLIKAGITTFQDYYGKDKVRTLLSIGDTSSAATFQRQSVLDQAFNGLGVQTVITPGNHDVGPVPRWIKESGMISTHGYTYVNGLSIWGKPDPEHTPFLEDSYFPDPAVTEVTLGQEAAEALGKKPVDILDLHEPAAMEAALGLSDFHRYLRSSEDKQLTSCDYGQGLVQHVPFALANAGHEHDQYPIKMVCNADGTWGVINVEGTSGGADEVPTINNWSDPDGRPVKPLVLQFFVRNTKHNSITGVVSVNVATNGHVENIHRVDIGTSDGAPFPLPGFGTTR
jgi:hypothetical protein